MSERKNIPPKKIVSKQKKSLKYIASDTGLDIGIGATKNIVVCNSGLALGLSQEDIITIFSAYGAIESIVMLPNKTYCFFAFANLSSSEEAYFNVHGKCVFPNSNSLIVLAFADRVPEVSPLWPFSSCDTPPGLLILEEFVNYEEEQKLIHCLEWENSNGSMMKHRQVQHFGYKFRYSSNDVDMGSPLKESIPKECDFLSSRLIQFGCVFENFCPDQLTVNRYFPGQGIPPHVDTHSVFADPILSLSLLSDVVMDFRDARGKKIPVLLPRRSLLIMAGESRYGWTHGITPRSSDIIQSTQNKGLTVMPRSERISFTFRKLLLEQNCSCSFPMFCDVKKTGLLKELNAAIDLEKTFVQEVYEEISNHFSATRHKAWPNVLLFCKTFKVGDVIIDVGCGNGKYFGHHPKSTVYEIGLDSSFGLTSLCAERGFAVVNGNCLSLPFQTGVADGCLCIAVIHHLSTHERRKHAIQEINRILRKGGRALIYVWARDQRCDNLQSCYLKESREDYHLACPAMSNQDVPSTTDHISEMISETVKLSESSSSTDQITEISNNEEPSRNLPLPVHCNRTNFQHNDVLVPWTLREKFVSNSEKQQTFYRYYHMFEQGELERLCSEIPRIQVVESRYDQGNWVVSFQKEDFS